MLTYLGDNISSLHYHDYAGLFSGDGTIDFIRLYDFLYLVIFTIDIGYAAAGYMMTFKLFDTHIRSAEPTALGWLVTVICYSPFWNILFYNHYLTYNDGYYWGHLTASYPALQVIWGSSILILILIYSSASVSFGLRFSNLTYRGLISNGVYRFSKHPAYIAKNLSWWLISVPFFSQAGWDEALSHSLMLLGLNFIYFLRVRTEENHLSNYPEYVRYAEWMNQHGIMRWMTRAFPALAYDAKRAKNSGSRPYWKNF